jgi:hypothetical protein
MRNISMDMPKCKAKSNFGLYRKFLSSCRHIDKRMRNIDMPNCKAKSKRTLWAEKAQYFPKTVSQPFMARNKDSGGSVGIKKTHPPGRKGASFLSPAIDELLRTRTAPRLAYLPSDSYAYSPNTPEIQGFCG